MSEFDKNASNLYETLEEALTNADCEISASEFQGVLAGMISAGLNATNNQWKSAVLEVVNDGHLLPAESQLVVENVFIESHRAFLEQDFLAPILVPGDDYPLIDRLEAVSFWCQGYLLGFGLQFGNAPINSSEISESLQDISEISQLEIESDESEESQMAMETLVEHIKVAVKVIYMELVVKKEQTVVRSVDGNDTYH